MKHRIIENMPHANEEPPENALSRMLLKENLDLRSSLRKTHAELRDAWKEIEKLKNTNSLKTELTSVTIGPDGNYEDKKSKD